MPTRDISSNLDALGQIRREAVNGHAKLKLMSQAVGLLKEHLSAKGHGGGICRSLAIEWLKCRKKGESLIDKALGPGGVVNVSVLKPMIAQYDSNPDLVDKQEDEYVYKQLTSAGLKSGGSSCVVSNQIKGGVGTWFTGNNNPKSNGPLRFVAVRKGYNHAMALDVASKTFFDPNWGEFEFTNEVDLNKFLNSSIFPGGKASTDYPEYCGVKSFMDAAMSCFSAA